MEIILTPKLTLNYIEDYYVKDDELIAVSLYFRFYGEEGTAELAIDKLDSEWASFAIVEMCSDLSDSFNSEIEEEWGGIVKAVKEYHERWKIEYEDFI